MSQSDTISGVGETHPSLDPPALAALLAQLTHELKTPLHSILSVASILASEMDGPLNDEQRRQVKMIERNAGTLFELISELLSFSSAAARSSELRWEALDLTRLCSEIADSIDSIAAQKAMRLHRDFRELPLEFVTDRFLLRQIISNLLQNAVKYSNEGGEVWFSVYLDGMKQLNIDVADSGGGINVKDQPLVFDSFYQTASGSEQRSGGVGLGLALVNASVKQLGGSVSVRSESERGALFHVVISAGPEVTVQEMPVVIIADRDQTVRLALSHIAAASGFHPVSVSSGAELTRELQSDRVKVALVEDELLMHLTSLSELGQVKARIIALLTLDGPTERERMRKAGACDVLCKPFDFSIVVSRLNQYGARRSE